MKRLLSIVICLFCLSTLSSGVTKSAFEEKRMKACWVIFCNLEKGLMGENDFAKAEILLQKAEGVERAWLVACIGQYHRELRGEPVAGIKTLIVECLGNKEAKEWVKELETAEKTHLYKWRYQVSKARQNRTSEPPKPSGLALPLPSMTQFNITTENTPAALELSRCLGRLGEVRKAIAVIDKCGTTLGGDEICLMLSYEALADLNRMNHEFNRAVQGYGTALKVFGALAKRKENYDENFSKWEEAAKARIRRKLNEVNRLIEAEKYGKGWVDYRDAEVVRLKNKDYIRALLMYDNIIKNYAETVYESAARCYSIKCLLELATRQKPKHGEDNQLNDLEKRHDNEEALLKKAKRCKVPEAGLKNIQQRIDDLENRIALIKSIPYGEEALVQAKNRAKDAASNLWGLYNGEVYFDLGSFALEYQYDEKLAATYFQQAAHWFNKVGQAGSVLAAYRVPGKASKVSAPPKDSRQSDSWGNVHPSTPDFGDIVNRQTASWYLTNLHLKTLMNQAIIDYLNKDHSAILEKAAAIRKKDPYFKMLEKSGFGSACSRLELVAKDQTDGLMAFPSPQEERIFRNSKVRTAATLGDFAYICENFVLARQRYVALLKRDDFQLSNNVKAYVSLRVALTVGQIDGFKKMMSMLDGFEMKYPNAPSLPKLFIYRANQKTQNHAAINRKSVESGRQDYLHLIKNYRNSPEAELALCYLGLDLMMDKEFMQAEKLFQRYLGKYPDGGLADCAKFNLQKCIDNTKK